MAFHHAQSDAANPSGNRCVPERPELWSDYAEHYGQFRRYTLASLNAEPAVAGFQPIRCGYLFKALYPAMFILTKFFRSRATMIASPRRKLLRLLLGVNFVGEQILMPRALWGTSVPAAAVPVAHGRDA